MNCIVNTNQNDLTLNNWNSSDDQFSIWTHQSDNSSNFFRLQFNPTHPLG